MNCKICNKKYDALSGHLKRKHGISTNEYYDMFFKKQDEDICMLDGCSGKNSFINLTIGYGKYCCREHSSKDVKWKEKVSKTWEVKTDDELRLLNKKRKDTCIDRYGDENYPFNSMKRVIKNKYGCDNSSQIPHVKIKMREYWDNKTDEVRQRIQKRRKETLLLKYGVTSLMLLDEYKENIQKAAEKYRIESGKYIPKEKQLEFGLYKRRVYSRTKHTAKKKFGESCSLIGRCGVDGAFQIDHLYTLKDGFINNVHPSILSHPCNLQLIPWLENDKKSESSITLIDLIESIKCFHGEKNEHGKT